MSVLRSVVSVAAFLTLAVAVSVSSSSVDAASRGALDCGGGHTPESEIHNHNDPMHGCRFPMEGVDFDNLNAAAGSFMGKCFDEYDFIINGNGFNLWEWTGSYAGDNGWTTDDLADIMIQHDYFGDAGLVAHEARHGLGGGEFEGEMSQGACGGFIVPPQPHPLQPTVVPEGGQK